MGVVAKHALCVQLEGATDCRRWYPYSPPPTPLPHSCDGGAVCVCPGLVLPVVGAVICDLSRTCAVCLGLVL